MLCMQGMRHALAKLNDCLSVQPDQRDLILLILPALCCFHTVSIVTQLILANSLPRAPISVASHLQIMFVLHQLV